MSRAATLGLSISPRKSRDSSSAPASSPRVRQTQRHAAGRLLQVLRRTEAYKSARFGRLRGSMLLRA